MVRNLLNFRVTNLDIYYIWSTLTIEKIIIDLKV